MKRPTSQPDMVLAFDIGHSSIGWAVLAADDNQPVRGAGTVIFRSEDNLNRHRAVHRRMRRHTAATRNRIRRLRTLFAQWGLVTPERLDATFTADGGIKAPFVEAARLLRGHPSAKPSAELLWHLVRWYAHNRGYDGNILWSNDGAVDADANDRDGEDEDDMAKLVAARQAMDATGQTTMAETMCAVLGIDDLADPPKHFEVYFKGKNLAFPRTVVVDEVRRLIAAHTEVLGADVASKLETALCDDWRAASDVFADEPKLKPVRRFAGGLLFGALMPRFDNRIIPYCPLTLRQTTRGAKAREERELVGNLGGAIDGPKARRAAERADEEIIVAQKTPLKHSRTFYAFRWAMIANNLRVKTEGGDKRPLDAGERKALNARMHALGVMTKRELERAVGDVTGVDATPVRDMFRDDEAAKALELAPEKKALLRVFAIGNRTIEPELKIAVWDALGEVALKRVFHGRPTTWEQLIPDAADPDTLRTALEALYNAAHPPAKGKAKKTSRKNKVPTFAQVLARPIPVSKTSGRARYCRPVMQAAIDEVMAGNDPTRAPANGDRGGCLYMDDDRRALEALIPLAKLTNNHIVRHRLLIYERLLGDLINRYAQGDPGRVRTVVTEVVRDLTKFSGLDAQEKTKLLNEIRRPHLQAEQKLRRHLEEAGKPDTERYTLIRKFRLWESQGKSCPYTGRAISEHDIIEGHVDYEHIIPQADRRTDALDSLVLTFTEINRRKGKRTAMEFIQAEQGRKLSSGSLADWAIYTPKQFEAHVKKMPNGRSKEERRRTDRRKALLLMEDFDPRHSAFTEQALAQTNYLNKLAALRTRLYFRQRDKESSTPRAKEVQVIHLEGRVTKFFTKSWRLNDVLAAVVPQSRAEDGRALHKGAQREITHLHHAIDALTIGCAALRVPGLHRRDVQTLIANQVVREGEERKELEAAAWAALGPAFVFKKRDRFEAAPLPKVFTQGMIQALEEKRVVMHLPRTMKGLKTDQNAFGLIGVERTEGKKGKVDVTIHVRGKSRDAEGKRNRRTLKKPFTEETALGLPRAERREGNRALLMVNENFGIAMLPEPVVIPWLNVWQQLEKLREKMPDGRMPEILRRGMLIEVPPGGKTKVPGRWRVGTIKNKRAGIKVELIRPHLISAKAAGYDDYREEVLIKTLIKQQMRILDPDLAGLSRESM